MIEPDPRGSSLHDGSRMKGLDAYETLKVVKRNDLLWVTLDNPSKANALSPKMVDEIIDLYGRQLRDDGIRAVLLRGAGKHFSAGADLGYLESLQRAGSEDNRADSARLRKLFSGILYQDTLTVALVHGSCIAGGCGIATAHDYVVATQDARFMYSESRIGFVAALVATYLPLRLNGRDLREMLLDPQLLGAERALAIGLINRVVAPKDLEAAGEALVTGILKHSSSESIARTKRLLLDMVGRPLDDAFERAAKANAAARATADCRHGIATFLETKKPPTWR